jgi:signal transduction histidine kinase
VVCDDIVNDPRMEFWREKALKRDYRASATFPLMQSGQSIGALSLYSSKIGVMSEDIIQMLKGMSADISLSLDFIAEIQSREKAQEELQDLSTFLQEALESERSHIARELHDELGQSMTALRFDLKWLSENIKATDKFSHEKLLSMNELVGQTVDSIRRISEDLRPGMLDDLGLAAAIENHVAKFSEQSGIACDLSMSHAEFDLDDQVATALFRIIQEALTNVARHSGASHVVIRLQKLEGKMLLIIQDNGRGLPLIQQTQKKTYGLLGMRERIKMLGGTLDIFNEKDTGVRIEACVLNHLKESS